MLSSLLLSPRNIIIGILILSLLTCGIVIKSQRSTLDGLRVTLGEYTQANKTLADLTRTQNDKIHEMGSNLEQLQSRLNKTREENSKLNSAIDKLKTDIIISKPITSCESGLTEMRIVQDKVKEIWTTRKLP
jgi:peptidoglycan hydrolase CwlO-like protein